MHDLSYNEKLKAIKLYSLQRRRERYCIIYVWKVLEGLVPNFSHPIIATLSDRRGRLCTISNVNVGSVANLAALGCVRFCFLTFLTRKICFF